MALESDGLPEFPSCPAGWLRGGTDCRALFLLVREDGVSHEAVGLLAAIAHARLIDALATHSRDHVETAVTEIRIEASRRGDYVRSQIAKSRLRWESAEMVRRYAHLAADHSAPYANRLGAVL